MPVLPHEMGIVALAQAVVVRIQGDGATCSPGPAMAWGRTVAAEVVA